MNKLFRFFLSSLAFLFCSSCNANTVVNDTIAIDTTVKINDKDGKGFNQVIDEISGYWYPISYTGSVGQAWTQADIDSFMKMYVFISADTIFDLTDTIFDLSYSIDTEDTEDFLRTNVYEFYNYQMLNSKIYDVFIRCKQRNFRIGEVFETTRGYAYDGKYLLTFKDGVTFLCEKQKLSTKFTGSGSMVKEYLLKGKERELNLSYEFFSDPDELIVYDQSKRVLYNSGMQSTKEAVSVNIPLAGVEKLVFRINTKSSKSQWRYEFSFK
jgi:hypothetical protein